MSGANVIESVKYLLFMLDCDIFALSIEKVRRVLDFTTITKVPKLPPFVRGVINLRGSVVPVADLRVKFGMSRSKTGETCVIITDVTVDNETSLLGILADSVEDVVDLESVQIEPAPKIGAKLKTEFIRGIGKREKRLVILLDIDQVFSTDELASVQVVKTEGVDVPTTTDIQ